MDLRVDGVPQRDRGGTFRLPPSVGSGRILRSATSRGAVSTIDLRPLRAELVSRPVVHLPAAETIVVAYEGSCRLETTGGTRTAEPGTVHRISGRVLGHRTPAGGRARRVVYHLLRPSGLPGMKALDARSLGLAGELFAQREPGSLAREAAALSLLAQLEEAPAPTEGVAERVRARLRAELHETPSLERLARAAGVSPRTLTRAVRAHYGVTVRGLLARERVAEAKVRLLASTVPAGALGLALGFSSPSHFSRVFRALTGETPSRYRQEGAAARRASA